MDESNITRVGRPYGGLAILWKNNLALSITPIKTNSSRLCAVNVKSDKINIIIFNIYMPCDNNSDESFDIFGDVLFDLLSILDTYRGFDLIMGGDFNVDFKRNESRNLGLLKQFIDEEFLNCITLDLPNDEYTYDNNRGNKSFITILFSAKV